MEHVVRATDALKSFRETRLSTLRPPQEFFDHHHLSRPQDLNQATQVRGASAKTSVIFNELIVIDAVYSEFRIIRDISLFIETFLGWVELGRITNPLLLISIAFLVGGFAAINRFAPEPLQVGDHVVTQKSLYIMLFVVGVPLLWWSSPLGTFFWLVGASSFVILFHASFMEPGIESEYAAVESGV
ncbi:ER to Golgi transport-related protein [Sanghuangporus baumii]|uniref:PRA1 family protein n=1 Tax=Sanghuangporus baumii TaxID=108892 RepID=A0A9Q5N6V5_SANBA|nr:ER to Golgi transport-related protein [Sanghuangporus baumii]